MKILAVIYLICWILSVLNFPILFKAKDEEWVRTLTNTQQNMILCSAVLTILITLVCLFICPAMAILILLQ